MNEFPKPRTGEDWATLKARYDKSMDELMDIYSPEHLIQLASYTSQVSELAVGVSGGDTVSVPVAYLKSLIHLSQSHIIDTLARLEAEYNAKTARAASQ